MADDVTPEPEPTPKPAKGKAKPAAEPLTADDVAELLKAHGGDQGAAIRSVMADRDKFRDEATELRGKLPKEGHVVLDPERAKTLAAYEAMGDPAGLAKAIEDGKTATAERDDLKFQSHMGEVASLQKWKPGVLADRVKASGIATLIKEEPNPKDAKGAKLRVPHVVLEGDKTTPLTDYAKEHWGDYLPALQTEPAKPEFSRGSPSSNGHTPARPAVVQKSDQPHRSLVR
jgi:hypothetical protein